MSCSVLLTNGNKMTSEQIRESYIRACQAFRNHTKRYAQVRTDLVAARERGEISDTDFKVVDQIWRSFGIIDTKSRVVV